MFFRISTQDKANELNLTGWVKNIFNNAVEIIAEGDREELSKLTGWLQLGPPNATVDKISIEWSDQPERQFLLLRSINENSVQINTILGNFEYNYDKIIKYYNKSIELNSDIVVFPELSITGYTPRSIINNEFINENLNILSKIAKNSTKPIIIGYVELARKYI